MWIYRHLCVISWFWLLHINAYKSTKARVMNIPKHVLNWPWVGQQYDVLSSCKHLILILRLSSILSQNDNSAWWYLVQNSSKLMMISFLQKKEMNFIFFPSDSSISHPSLKSAWLQLCEPRKTLWWVVVVGVSRIIHEHETISIWLKWIALG